MIRAVLWDLDGTLVDSEGLHWTAWRETMAGEGVALTRSQFEATFGQRNDTILPRWLGSGATAEQMRRVGEAKEERYRQLVREQGLSPLPGAADWLRRLHKAGWRQAIASSAPRANVDTVLDVLGFHGLLHTTVSAEDVDKGKPNPQVFLVAAARLEASPASCIVVEDAAVGIEAARRAGMRSIGVGRNGAKLGAADMVVHSLDALGAAAFGDLLDGC